MNKKLIFPFSDTIEGLSELMETFEDERPQHIGDLLDANAEQENLEVLDATEPVDEAELPECRASENREKTLFKPITVD